MNKELIRNIEYVDRLTPEGRKDIKDYVIKLEQEIKSLEIQVKHYEEKEKRLIEFIENEIKTGDTNQKSANEYGDKMGWVFYQRALIKVQKEIYKLERVR